MDDKLIISSGLLAIRRFEAIDRDALLKLWPADVMHSQPAPDENGMLNSFLVAGVSGKHHIWVAQGFGRIVGWAVVICDNSLRAHLKCLCVAHDVAERQVIARALAEHAIKDVWERGYLKLVVHTDLAPDQIVKGIEGLGFEFTRERQSAGDHVVEFYQNLYERPHPPSSRDGESGVVL